MKIDKIRELFESSRDRHAEARRIGTTYQTMYNLLYKGSVCKVDLIEKIAGYYKKPVGYFFDGDSDEDTKRELASAKDEIRRLRDEVGKLTASSRSSSRRVLVAFDLEADELIQMGIKERFIKILDAKQ